jgi:hypothetical protein
MRPRFARHNPHLQRFYRPACEQLERRDVPAGVWSAGPAAYGGIGTMMLLSDGTVMAQSGEYWMRLSPDSHGSYTNGSWGAMAQSMLNTNRLYFGSALLPNGNVFVVGGEYSTLGYYQNLTNTSETYDPMTDTWGYNANFPAGNFGDDPVMVLPNGNVLAGYVFGPQTYIYNPSLNTWTNGPNKFYNDSSDEETWTRLPNGNILNYDIFTSINTGISAGEVYNPNTNTWSPTTNSAANPPGLLSSPGIGYELGPALLLPDGRVFQVGANGNTAFYDYHTNTWSAGPQIVDAGGHVLGADDAAGAILPNGQVIFAADNGPSSGTFHGPTELFTFDPTTNTITQIPSASLPAGLVSDLNGEGSYVTRMVMLPSGQLAFSDSSSQLWLFTLSGNVVPSASRPAVTNVSYNAGTGQFNVTGYRLTGLSEGSSYGDDVSNSTNYPIVQLRNSSGTDYFAYSTGWTSGVSAPGDTTPQSFQFILPDGVAAGTYVMTVSANGIASFPVSVFVTAAQQTLLPNVVVTSASQNTYTYDYFDYYYFGGTYQFQPYNPSYNNTATGNYSQFDWGAYFNSNFANAYGATNLAQQLNYYRHIGIATAANAYANPVQNNSNYYGYYAYSESKATDQLNFTLGTDSLVTFDYNVGASAVTGGGGTHAYAYSYGEVYNFGTGGYYYAYAFAEAYNGGGPYSFAGAGSGQIFLPAGSYALYGYSYTYAYGNANTAALASAYNGTAISNITPYLAAAYGGARLLPGTGAQAPGIGLPLGPPPNPGSLSIAPDALGQAMAGAGADTNPNGLCTAPSAPAAPGVGTAPPTISGDATVLLGTGGSHSGTAALLGYLHPATHSDDADLILAAFLQPFKPTRLGDLA